MTKDTIQEWDATAANNTDIGGVNIAESCAPSGINNAIREHMAQIKTALTGSDTGIVTGTAGTNGNKAIWNADGDLVDDDAIDIDISTATASVAYDIPATWKGFRLIVSRFNPATNNAFLAMQIGANGAGGAFENSTGYVNHALVAVDATVSANTSTTNGFDMSANTRNTFGGEGVVDMSFIGMNTAARIVVGTGTVAGVNSSGENVVIARNSRLTVNGNWNAVNLFASSGNISNLQARIERLL